MDVDQFWNLIQTSAGVGKRLASLLQQLKPEEIRGFGDLVDLFRNKAFTWNLWGAAYLINGGCSDEEFDQFIYWLISLGKEKYENVVKDPDFLAEILTEDDITFNEDIIISIARSLDRLDKSIDGRSSVIIPAELIEHQQKPKKPQGHEWRNDEDLITMFPKLGEKFGHMIEWDEEEEEGEWDEDKGKSKIRRAWDKFVEFFAGIFDKFLNLFRRKKKGKEEEEKAEEVDPNRLRTKLGINFWMYLTFLVMSLGFVALIICTRVIQNNITEKIAALRSLQALDLQKYIGIWNYLTDVIIERFIDNRWTGLSQRIPKWGYLQYLWVILMITCLIAGLPFIKLIFQHRFVILNPKSLEFLNRKEQIRDTINLKDIESIQYNRSNSFHIITKKNTEHSQMILLDMVSIKALKKYCMEQKIPTNEDSQLIFMIYKFVMNKIERRSGR